MADTEFTAMCQGPNEAKAADHADRARFHSLMAKFYRLPQKEQRLFMAMFNEMVRQDDA